MSFSYSGDPALSVLDHVRFLIDDRTPPPFLEDEEILAITSQVPNVFRAAADCADQIALQLGKRAQSKTVSGLSISRPELRRSYVELAARLRDRALLQGTVIPTAGGLSKAEKQDQRGDPDAVQPIFRKETGIAEVSRLDPRTGFH